MPFRPRVKIVAKLLALALLLAGGAVLVRTPAFAALTRSKDAFQPHPVDGRVFFEAGAEEQAAAVAAFLGTAVERVETFHGRPFEKPVRVYMCTTQASLNAFIALPPRAPIRGTVRLGEVFLAPSAFRWLGNDTHRESLLHELSHLHLRQQLGFMAFRARVPSWFHEGLADLVSGAGGEGISRQEAVGAILHGPALMPDSTGRLWSLRPVTDYGMPTPMLHAQSTLFLSFLKDRDPGAFRRFLLELQEQKDFAAPFRRHFGGGVGDLWTEFVEGLGADQGA